MNEVQEFVEAFLGGLAVLIGLATAVFICASIVFYVMELCK
jgi:site-specific DNA-adenine methylase